MPEGQRIEGPVAVSHYGAYAVNKYADAGYVDIVRGGDVQMRILVQVGQRDRNRTRCGRNGRATAESAAPDSEMEIDRTSGRAHDRVEVAVLVHVPQRNILAASGREVEARLERAVPIPKERGERAAVHDHHVLLAVAVQIRDLQLLGGRGHRVSIGKRAEGAVAVAEPHAEVRTLEMDHVALAVPVHVLQMHGTTARHHGQLWSEGPVSVVELHGDRGGTRLDGPHEVRVEVAVEGGESRPYSPRREALDLLVGRVSISTQHAHRGCHQHQVQDSIPVDIGDGCDLAENSGVGEKKRLLEEAPGSRGGRSPQEGEGR